MRVGFWTLFAAFSTMLPMALAQPRCAGDCDGDQRVTVDELAIGTRVALRQQDLGHCVRLDVNRDLRVDASELTLAVTTALRGCAPTTEDVALFGVYDVIGSYLYASGSHRRQGIGVIGMNRGGEVELSIDFDQFTSPTFRLRTTAPQTVRLDGHSLEEGDIAQGVSGSAHISVKSRQITFNGRVDATNPFFPSLSHAIDLELKRYDGDYASRLAGVWKLTFDANQVLDAVIPIRPGTNGIGTCGPAEMADASGTIVHHLEEAPCYFSIGGGFLYRGSVVTLRGALLNSYQFTYGEGTWAEGFGIGTGQGGEWSARRVAMEAEQR